MKRFLLTLSFLVYIVDGVFAAPAVIGTPVVGNSGASAGSTNLTVSATCPSGNSNVVAVACVSTHRATANAVTLDSVKWNNVTMTSTGTAAADGANNGSYAEMYYLTNPTCDGSPHNFVITVNTNSFFLVGSILFLKDTNQAAPFDAPQSSTTGTNDAAPTVNVTSTTGDLVIDCIAARNSNTNLAAGAGQTNTAGVGQTSNATAANNEEGAQSYENGASTVTMSWTNDANSISWAIVAASFNPAQTSRRRAAPRYYMKLLDPLLFGPIRVSQLESR